MDGFTIGWLIFGFFGGFLTQGIIYGHAQRNFVHIQDDHRKWDLLFSMGMWGVTIIFPFSLVVTFFVWCMGKHKPLFFWQRDMRMKGYTIFSKTPDENGVRIFRIEAQNRETAMVTFSFLHDVEIDTIHCNGYI